MNNNISVVTVTYNNEVGLNKTLRSLSKIINKPYKVVVVDGLSHDNTCDVIKTYCADLNIEYISEKDDGIYYAMNKGLKYVKTKLVHFLNAGDEVYGEPYENVNAPCVLPVMIKIPRTGKLWEDKIKMNGYGYCHQGIIFPSNNIYYDTRYEIASDYNYIIDVFPEGLSFLKQCVAGGVVYYLDGTSSIRYKKGEQEIIEISFKKMPFYSAIKIWLYIKAKAMLPRYVRRRIMQGINY